MPLYDYDCAACGRRFEVIHGLNDPSPQQCPLCGSGPVRKAFAAPAVHFKGSGWAKKERRAAVKSAASSTKDGEKGADGDASSKTPEKPSTSTSESGTTSGSASSPASTSSTSSD
ncbi:MAG TPA: zinc ribbon domain-containing protein [Candidatus Limnocylindrales bacterium]|nr:zinc ribbon domain-containing protein [Candidatus Limnocylindrales bacterium]